jgi:hypothetical protein
MVSSIFLPILLLLTVDFVYGSFRDKVKLFKVPESQILCKKQFEKFLESLTKRDEWANDSNN